METNPLPHPPARAKAGAKRTLTIASFNVLADCYTDAFRKRTQGLDQRQNGEAERHLRWKHRRPLLTQVLTDLARTSQADLLCLQEVDRYASFYAPLLTEIGFDHVYYQRPSRKDGLVIAWRMDRFGLRRKIEVDFNQIQGLPPNGRKHNVGLLCVLYEMHRPQNDVVVANTHLHWNPARRLLKLMQASRFLEVVADVVRGEGKDMPCFVCGDFNSLPESPVVQLMRKGAHVEEPAKGFFCDASLGKVVRYLRALGVDCLHEQGLTSDAALLFEQCRESSRLLITRSKSLYSRKDCPPACLIKSTNAESSLLQVVEECNLVVDEELFYTRCVKCNGNIETVDRCDIPSSRIGRESSERDKDRKNYIPTELFNQEDVPLAQCDGCEQIYWWSKDETTVRVTKNSSVRAKETVTKLTDIVSRRECSRVNRHLEMRVHGRTFVSTVQLESAMLEVHGKEVKTNNTEQFKGCIDYIFYHKLAAENRVDPVSAYTLPPTEDESILPSSNWPSDHKCIVARFALHM